MPRLMPRYDLTLRGQADLANGIVTAGETVRLTGGVGREQWTLARVELLYELAYLRFFVMWEELLECVFFRSLCGYQSRAGQEVLVPAACGPGFIGPHFRSLSGAETVVYGGADFLLWHDPDKVIKRCKKYILSGPGAGPAQQENVITSSYDRLKHFAAIRHRIAHEQEDARNKFDTATHHFVGHKYAASRPGRFLRDFEPASAPPKRWLAAIADELIGLMGQIC
jgi:hypothetical protein